MLTVITQLFQTVSAERFAIRRQRTKQPMPPHLVHLLVGAQVGQPMRLVAVHADHKMVHRLAELGLTPGVTLTIVQAAGGPFLVAVRGARIAIGRELAQQLEVAPLC